MIRGDKVFNRDCIGVYLDDSSIRIMIGNKNKIKHWGTFDIIKEDSPEENIDIMDTVYESIKNFIKEKNSNVNDILFCITGSDIVTRHVEVPIMNKKGLKDLVKWEMNQYLPGGDSEYYIDFQTIERVENEEKKVYKLLAAAVSKDRIDKLMELSQKLKLKLKAVDISSNCISRVFKGDKGGSNPKNSTGIINMGDRTSSIIILDKGNLFIEREVPFGTKNVIREIARRLKTDENEAESYLSDVFDFSRASESIEVENRVITMFDNVLSSFLKVIQFYTTGKVKKTLDEIYITGSACNIHGLEHYIGNYFNCPASIVNSYKELPSKIKISEACDVKLYLDVIGLLLRKE